jgi:hypothetical protein
VSSDTGRPHDDGHQRPGHGPRHRPRRVFRRRARSADGAVLAVFIVDDTGIDPALLRELYTIAPTNPAAAAYG